MLRSTLPNELAEQTGTELSGIKRMMRRILFFLGLFALSTSGLLAQGKAAASEKSTAAAALPPAYGERLHVAGIPNAGKVNEVLYRGAQPHAESFPQLKELGITTIVDLRREDHNKVEWERRQAEAVGIRFVNIPVGGWSAPNDEQVAEFLSLFHSNPQEKVFVHCRFGHDRTGLFVAAYRMAVEKWPAEEAVKEMYSFGFSGFWHPAMKEFVREFPDHLKSSPSLASLRAQPSAP